ncbi:sushi, von Willebrand factor type A, EGF and pentraxin domain-containing protein 1-like isoform X2 [Sycon ciliatum]|uniref:sushi, von Willebrand factor type A, EGF and pentraxin domain-containing protein 1-like isoform X2 n=1 Tax=Sycon ciliatum TaxID=27933 RepID=UPI0031F6BD73
MAGRAAVILLAFLAALTEGTCPAPQLPVDGNYHIGGYGKGVSRLPYQRGDVVTLVCNTGFIGSIDAVCQSDDTWSTLSPNCQRISCPHPSPLTNGGYPRTDSDYQDTIRYQCDAGFFMVGHPSNILTVRCLADRTWSQRKPTCQQIHCADPGPPFYGQYIRTGLDLGDIIRYRCNRGYEMQNIPSDTLVVACTGTGRWSRPRPTCQRISCPHPSPLTNGVYPRRDSNFLYLDVLRYQCNIGYFMVGHPSGFLAVQCLANRTWSHPKPTCQQIHCADPGPPFYGQYIRTGLDLGDIIRYRCNRGYEMPNIPSGTLTVACTGTGRWSRLKPTCQPRAQPPAGGGSNSTDEASLSLHFSILLGIVIGIVIMAVPLLWACRRQWRKTVPKEHGESGETEQQVVQMPTLMDNEAYGSANGSNAEEDTGYECVA